MSAGTLKQMIIELTRGGCRIEVLAHEPVTVTFRAPTGARYALTTDQREFELAREDRGPQGSARFGSMQEAIRAACLA
jgi:hypothetical protein